MQKDMTQIRKRAINLPPFIQNVCFIAISWPISALNKYVTYLCVYRFFLCPSIGLPLKSKLSAQEKFERGSPLFSHSQKNPSLSFNWLNGVLVAPAPVLVRLWWGDLETERVGDMTQRTPKGHPGPKAGSTRLKTGIFGPKAQAGFR